jgi:hypothetical protein
MTTKCSEEGLAELLSKSKDLNIIGGAGNRDEILALLG